MYAPDYDPGWASVAASLEFSILPKPTTNVIIHVINVDPGMASIAKRRFTDPFNAFAKVDRLQYECEFISWRFVGNMRTS